MFKSQAKAIFTVVLLAIVAVVLQFVENNQAARLQSNSARAQSSAIFDHYVLALSWQPAFCQRYSNNPECRQLAPFSGREFVLHGLWPEGRETVFCGVSSVNRRAADRRQWCDIDALPLTSGMQSKLSHLMPASDRPRCLDRYQWAKHGSCSGLDPASYYQLSMDLVAAFARSEVSNFIENNRGKMIGLKQLYQELAKDFGHEGRQQVQAICKNEALQELRITIRKNVKPLDGFSDWLVLAGKRKSARCPDRFKVF